MAYPPFMLGPMGAGNDALLGLNPSANLSGGNAPQSPAPGNLGGPSNPFLAPFPTGQNVPGITSPYAPSSPAPGGGGQFPFFGSGGGVPFFGSGGGSAPPPAAGSGGGAFPANTGGTSVGPPPSVTGLSASGAGTGVGSTGLSVSGLAKEIAKGTGIPNSIATLLAQFLLGGAGYSPQVAQALIAQLQPSIERGQEDIMEQFSAMGNRFGSPAAIGLGDYMSQVNLNIGEILSGLYEQSVQNYMNVLMGIKKPQQQSGGTLGGLGALLGGIGGILGTSTGGGGTLLGDIGGKIGL